MKPEVVSFFDQATNTVSHVVRDPASRACAVIDPVLDFDPASGSTDTRGVDALISYVESESLEVALILETHAHADHLSAAPHVQQRCGGQTAIGEHIVQVQDIFGQAFNAGDEFARDGSQFDRLLADGEAFRIGALEGMAVYVPGHTPACMAYVIGDAIFSGDTLFMPDYGTARCDFPGGDARQLYRSIRRLMSLPDTARLFLCHDYLAPGRDQFAWETTIGAERLHNVHVHEGVSEEAFVAMRTARRTLGMPRLLLPSVQVNMRGGQLPGPEGNGLSYLKLPVNAFRPVKG
nr:MBL fold metallo-hydrolase [Paraburkholderia tropica]